MTIYIRWLIKIPLSANGHSSRINMLLSRNFRELHVYLSRGQCWATTPLMKIRSPPAKLCQRITDHFLIAFLNIELASRNPFSGQIVADYFFARFTDPPFNMHFDFRPLLRRTFAKISLFTDPGALKEKRTPGALVFGSRKAALLKAWLLRLELVS